MWEESVKKTKLKLVDFSTRGGGSARSNFQLKKKGLKRCVLPIIILRRTYSFQSLDEGTLSSLDPGLKGAQTFKALNKGHLTIVRGPNLYFSMNVL